MKNSHVLLVVIVLVIVVMASAQQSQRTSALATPARFSLVSAQAPATDLPYSRSTDLFVIDTQTGRVWEYIPPHMAGKFSVGPYFDPIPFSQKPSLAEGQADRP